MSLEDALARILADPDYSLIALNGHQERAGLADFAVDWSTAWDVETNDSDWLLEPLVAKGRGHALYAPAKTGKSLIVLEAAAALATGRPFLGWPGGTCHDVGYLDYEMTLADLMERLTAFGYGPGDDLSHLHYILLPSIPTLDTAEGAALVVDAATKWGCEWVVIDTMGRAVSGDENDADTYRAFYRATGIALKSAGIAYHRLDHAGKDLERGQRGSSAKNDDVDVVQKLTRLDGGAMRLEATHRRMSWVPERVDLLQVEDELAGTVSHLVSEELLAPDGVSRIIKTLDRLGLPTDVSQRAARRALKEAGEKCRTTVLCEALKRRSGVIPGRNEAILAEVFGIGRESEDETPDPDAGNQWESRESAQLTPDSQTTLRSLGIGDQCPEGGGLFR